MNGTMGKRRGRREKKGRKKKGKKGKKMKDMYLGAPACCLNNHIWMFA